jgi:hypothetical protein
MGVFRVFHYVSGVYENLLATVLLHCDRGAGNGTRARGLPRRLGQMMTQPISIQCSKEAWRRAKVQSAA